jgi:hypothetical protein
MTSAKQSIEQQVFGWIGIAAIAPGTALAICGVLQFGNQVLLWARTGQWIALPAYLLFEERMAVPEYRFIPDLFWGRGFIDWLLAPQDWVGISKIVAAVLSSLSSPLVCFFGGLALIFAAMWALDWLATSMKTWTKSEDTL